MGDWAEDKARRFWREHAEQFNEMTSANCSDAEYDAETARVKAHNEEGIASLAALLREVRARTLAEVRRVVDEELRNSADVTARIRILARLEKL